jgi:transposase InsO family protein
MKRPNKKLLDDLLEDSASPDFYAEVMDKTLHSARWRKHMRYRRIALAAAALMGVLTFAFRTMRERAVAPNRNPPQTLAAAVQPALVPPQVVSTRPDPNLTVVQTSASNQPREINDKELVTLLSGQPVALVRYASSEAELISLDQSN